MNNQDYINTLKIRNDKYINILNEKEKISKLNISYGLQLLINEIIKLPAEPLFNNSVFKLDNNYSNYWKTNLETKEIFIKKNIVASRLPCIFRHKNYMKIIKNINLYFEYNKIKLRIDDFNIDIVKKPEFSGYILCEQNYAKIYSYNSIVDFSCSIENLEKNFRYASPHYVNSNFKLDSQPYPHVFLLNKDYYDKNYSNEEFPLSIVSYLNDDIWTYDNTAESFIDYCDCNDDCLFSHYNGISPFGDICKSDCIIMRFIITKLNF